MQRHLLTAALLWILLTLVGETLFLNASIYPLAAAAEAETVDSAFRLLTVLGLPVATLVLAVLLYSVLRFRSRGEPAEEGPPIHGSRPVTVTWLLVSTGLTVFVIFNPGLSGLAELTRPEPPDLVVQVQAAQWFWKVTYPEHELTSTEELVLPVGKRVRFEVTSADVLHSFWVPAFRMKIDAVPGRVTQVYVTPTRTGRFDDEFNLRLQCAELCGVGHAIMQMPVRVLDQAGFDLWIIEAKGR